MSRRKRKFSAFKKRVVYLRVISQVSSELTGEQEGSKDMSNITVTRGVHEEKVFTISGCHGILGLMEMTDLDRRDILYTRLRSLYPKNNNFHKDEIKKIVCHVNDPYDVTDNKVFVELLSQERRNEIVTNFWNPIEKTLRLEISLSLCSYDKGLDGEHLMSWTLTHEGTPPGGQDQRVKQTNKELSHMEVASGLSYGATSESPLRRPRKRVKSNHAILQEISISEAVKDKLNRHKLIEDYTRKNIFEMVVFALKYRKDTSRLTLRNWLLDNLESSGKRTLIQIHTSKTFGFEWNAYDLAVNALWQRKWVKALKLDNDRILEEIKKEGSMERRSN